MLIPFHLSTSTISSAWFELLYNLFDHSYRQDMQAGSFSDDKTQYRLQYPGISVFIEHPELDMVPVIPQHLVAQGITPPSSEEVIQDYFANYLMDPEIAENETYRYSSRIHERISTGTVGGVRQSITQFDKILQMLKDTPLTNQAVIEIAKPSDIEKCIGNDGKLDPPCLRLIDFKVVPVQTWGYQNPEGWQPRFEGDQGVRVLIHEELALTLTAYFRSWDLWAGFPVNLGGLELLKQYVASECGLVNGPMYAYSAGAHIYGYAEDMARIRTMRPEVK